MLHWMTRTALELIGQSGLGYSFDTLAENTANPFVKHIKKLGFVTTVLSKLSMR
jgi:hypothetical protein